jgi:hypothetical protein
MAPKSVTIDDKTQISLYAVIGCIPILVGGLIWLTNIDAKASAAQIDLQNTKELLKQALTKLEKIDSRLSHIEGWIEKR